MHHRTAADRWMTTALGLTVAVAFAVAMLFPHAHVVYCDTHDDETCVLMALVTSGALALATAACAVLVFAVLGHLPMLRTVSVLGAVSLPFSSRAPPR